MGVPNDPVPRAGGGLGLGVEKPRTLQGLRHGPQKTEGDEPAKPSRRPKPNCQVKGKNPPRQVGPYFFVLTTSAPLALASLTRTSEAFFWSSG